MPHHHLHRVPGHLQARHDSDVSHSRHAQCPTVYWRLVPGNGRHSHHCCPWQLLQCCHQNMAASANHRVEHRSGWNRAAHLEGLNPELLQWWYGDQKVMLVENGIRWWECPTHVSIAVAVNTSATGDAASRALLSSHTMQLSQKAETAWAGRPKSAECEECQEVCRECLPLLEPFMILARSADPCR